MPLSELDQIRMGPHGKHQLSNKKESLKSVQPVESSELSCATAFSFSLLRIVKPVHFYSDLPDGSQKVVHFFSSGLMLVASSIGFLNSCVTLYRPANENTGKNVTIWLLMHSIFETSRIVYIFLCEIILKEQGQLRIYDLLCSCIQYLLDSYLYCQTVLRSN